MRLTDFFQFQADSRDPRTNEGEDTNKVLRSGTRHASNGNGNGRTEVVVDPLEIRNQSLKVKSDNNRVGVSEASAMAQLGLSELDQDIGELNSIYLFHTSVLFIVITDFIIVYC